MVFGSVSFVFVGRCCGFAENKIAVSLFFYFVFCLFLLSFLAVFFWLVPFVFVRWFG